MHRIAIAGLSLSDTDLAGVEQLGRGLGPDGAARALGLRNLADELGASELVCLETCNRVEIAFAREEGTLPEEADLEQLARALAPEGASELRERLHFHVGPAAVRYLFRVAASLESLIVGEDQILAQVRDAFQTSERAGLIGPLLSPLFRQALQTGKLVRTKTELSRHSVSIVSIAVAELERRAQASGRASLNGCRALIVGAGKMGQLFVPALAEIGVEVRAIANRSPENARRLAAKISAECRALSLDELKSESGTCAEPFDIVVSVTGASDIVLGPNELGRLAQRLASAQPKKQLLAVDVALPRDLDAGGDPRVLLIDIEALRELASHNLSKRQHAAERAALIVEERAETFCARRSDPLVAEALADLHAQTNELVNHELRALLDGPGPFRELAPESRERCAEVLAPVLEKWARRLSGKLNHIASGRLKRLASDMDMAAEPPEELS